MMYSENFTVCIKTQGKILRENKDTVTLPFGCEYSILLKNLNSVRALAKVSVDGQDATEGTWLIIPANGNLELERFIKNGNFNQGNRFKFIERTAEIEQHRGIGAEDGLVRVEYKKEVVPVFKPVINYNWNDPWDRRNSWKPYQYRDRRSPYWGTLTKSSAPSRSMGSSARGSSTISAHQFSQSTMIPGMDSVSENSCSVSNFNDAGITVAGSQSNQQFVYGAHFETENVSSVIVLKLRGQVGKHVAYRPVTVKHKAECTTCGKSNKGTSQFCSSCGTSLVLI